MLRQRIVCLALVVVALSAALVFGEDAIFTKTKIVLQEGEESKEYDARVAFTDDKRLVIEDRKEKDKPWAARIPFDQIQKITYEKSSHPRAKTAIFISPLALLAKGKKHWLTVTYSNGAETDFVILHLDKKEYQRMITVAETKTGTVVERITEAE